LPSRRWSVPTSSACLSWSCRDEREAAEIEYGAALGEWREIPATVSDPCAFVIRAAAAARRLARRRPDRRSPGLAGGSHDRALDRRRQLSRLGGTRNGPRPGRDRRAAPRRHSAAQRSSAFSTGSRAVLRCSERSPSVRSATGSGGEITFVGLVRDRTRHLSDARHAAVPSARARRGCSRDRAVLSICERLRLLQSGVSRAGSASRLGSSSSMRPSSTPRIAPATSSPDMNPSTLPWPE
jgi:hypothetical protein